MGNGSIMAETSCGELGEMEAVDPKSASACPANNLKLISDYPS